MIKRILYRRLERLEAHVLPANRMPRFHTIYAHARDGKPAGSSVIGPDGRHDFVQHRVDGLRAGYGNERSGRVL